MKISAKELKQLIEEELGLVQEQEINIEGVDALFAAQDPKILIFRDEVAAALWPKLTPEEKKAAVGSLMTAPEEGEGIGL